MLTKYEEMKEKLSATKGHLDEKNKQISNQAKLTEQILAMKGRVEAYATKKEAVSTRSVKVLSKDHKEGMETPKINMQKHAETMEKREQMKAMLEKQVELEEKRAVEQNKIAGCWR